MTTREGLIKKRVKDVLALGGRIYTFMPVQRGFGPAGLDYFCCFKGRFLAVETKVPGKKLTPRQIVTATTIAKAGGMVCVIRDDDDMRMMMHLLSERDHNGVIYDTLGSEELYGEFWCN